MVEVIGVRQTAYSGWERKARIPCRKENNKILAALNELKVDVNTYFAESASI